MPPLLPRSPGDALMRGDQALRWVQGARDLAAAVAPPAPPPVRGVAPPPRAHLVNTDTAEDVVVQFNPEELQRQVAVDYRRYRVDGASYQPLQYVQTRNQRITFNVALSAVLGEREALDDRLRFLESLVYPGEQLGSPPIVLFVWPNHLSIEGVVVQWSEVTRRYAGDSLGILAAVVELTFEEARAIPITSESVRERGGRR